MHIMAGRAGDTVFVHDALHKVVALHPVLVCGSICEVSERRLAQGDVFKLPIIFQVQTDVISNRPVVSLTLNLLGERLTL